MNFAEPKPLTQILATLDAKTPMGSVMRTAEWEQMPQDLRDSAFFSAGVTNANFLQQQQSALHDMIARARETNPAGESMWKMDRGQFIKQLRVLGESLGIEHPDGRKGGVNEKDITDPISIARLKLVVNTQLELAYGQGQYVAAMDPDILSEWPAWELVRITPKKAPRDWDARWREAADAVGWEGVSREAFQQGRKIALKTSGIWIRLSRFGKPHSPFDYNSGMGTEEVDIDTAASYGLSHGTSAHQPQPKIQPLSSGIKAPVKNLDKDMQKRLQQVSGGRIKIAADEATLAQDAAENADLVKVPYVVPPEPQTQPEQIPTRRKARRRAKADKGGAKP